MAKFSTPEEQKATKNRSFSRVQAHATTAKAQATAAAAKAQLASFPAKLTFYAGVDKFGIQVAVIVVSGAGACAA